MYEQAIKNREIENFLMEEPEKMAEVVNVFINKRHTTNVLTQGVCCVSPCGN
jgi:Ethanolamine utilization protein EutJ (predicted chaperonin)